MVKITAEQIHSIRQTTQKMRDHIINLEGVLSRAQSFLDLEIQCNECPTLDVWTSEVHAEYQNIKAKLAAAYKELP